MRTDHRITAAVALGALLVFGGVLALSAQVTTRTWSDVMYLGGVAGVRGKSLDWENTLTISSDKIIFAGKKIAFDVDTRTVRQLRYAGHQHTNDGAAAAGFVAAGLLGALVGSTARSTDHYLEIEYVLIDGMPAAFLLRLHKDNQQQIIDAMHAATGIAK